MSLYLGYPFSMSVPFKYRSSLSHSLIEQHSFTLSLPFFDVLFSLSLSSIKLFPFAFKSYLMFISLMVLFISGSRQLSCHVQGHRRGDPDGRGPGLGGPEGVGHVVELGDEADGRRRSSDRSRKARNYLRQKIGGIRRKRKNSGVELIKLFFLRSLVRCLWVKPGTIFTTLHFLY